MLQEGQVFAGRYKVEGRIAQGGMGVIYAAEHLATEERVALKVLWPHVLSSTAAVENFQLEARIAARLGSEHIVRILDAGFDEAAGLPFLAMELLRGETLEALVLERGPLAPAEVYVLTRQVAQALDRAHGYVDRDGRPAPIVHRDLKPENLFLARREGGEPIVKVLDFGVAKVLTASHKLSQELRGTPLFMASEQVSGGPVTPSLDVWALGLIVYFLLTGRYYWRVANDRDGTMMRLLNEVALQPLEAPSARARASGVAPNWTEAFDAWFLRCVNRDIDARYASAGAAVEALADAFAAAGVPVARGGLNVLAVRGSGDVAVGRGSGAPAPWQPAAALGFTPPRPPSSRDAAVAPAEPGAAGPYLPLVSPLPPMTEVLPALGSWPSATGGPLLAQATVTTGNAVSAPALVRPPRRSPSARRWVALGVVVVAACGLVSAALRYPELVGRGGATRGVGLAGPSAGSEPASLLSVGAPASAAAGAPAPATVGGASAGVASSWAVRAGAAGAASAPTDVIGGATGLSATARGAASGAEATGGGAGGAAVRGRPGGRRPAKPPHQDLYDER